MYIDWKVLHHSDVYNSEMYIFIYIRSVKSLKLSNPFIKISLPLWCIHDHVSMCSNWIESFQTNVVHYCSRNQLAIVSARTDLITIHKWGCFDVPLLWRGYILAAMAARPNDGYTVYALCFIVALNIYKLHPSRGFKTNANNWAGINADLWSWEIIFGPVRVSNMRVHWIELYRQRAV